MEKQSLDLCDLFNNGRLPASENKTEMPEAESPQKKIELKKKPCAPEPGELKLIIITCKTFLKSNINLDLIARQLEIDDLVLGVKLLGVAQKGLIKSKNQTGRGRGRGRSRLERKKNTNTHREDFSNQCTVIIQPTGYNKNLNLKLFANGKIVITGGLSKDLVMSGINILKEKIRPLEADYQIKSNLQFSDCFDCVAKYLKYINKNYLIFLKLFSLYGINIDLRLDLVLNKKLVSKYPMVCPQTGRMIERNLMELNINQLVKDNIIVSGSNKDIDNYIKIIQVFNICHFYFSQPVLLDKLDQSDHFVHQLIDQLYSLEKLKLPVTFDQQEFDQNHEISIENYNTMFDCNFHLDRVELTHLLDVKYKSCTSSSFKISSSKFEPTSYQGINAKYISRVLCHSDCQSLGKKKTSKCPCKEISFLIFQEGKVIITGGRSWDQIMDGYLVITQILKDEYHNIMIEQRQKNNQSNTNLPPQIIKQSSNDKKIVYLNKKQQIIGNPRNFFLLKQLGLLSKYL